jgi:ribonuclease J
LFLANSTSKDNRKRKKRKPASVGRNRSLRLIPLGGVGEIGKNMYVLEYGNDIIVIDSGLMFPDDEMLGIDFVIPDISYLLKNRKKIRAILVTHGHEDHIGGLPFILPRLDVPVYGTRLTLALIDRKMEEAVPDYERDLREIKAGETISAGVFSIKFFAVCHSIPDGVGLSIDTPMGTVVHTGDIKLDPSPVDGRVTDYGAFAEAAKKGVVLMLSDSTNAERKGFTPSESIIGDTLGNLFRSHKNQRIIISAFASNLHRVQQVINTAAQFNRKISFQGRSMISNVEIASRLGYLDLDEKMVIGHNELNKYPHKKVVVLTTGSQGEPFSGLVLMSQGQHRNVNLGSRDVVAVFATPIPGNEKTVSNTLNRLFKFGCDVIYEKDRDIHVSGHASREELKILLNMVRPRYFVPFHGEYRHLVRHTQLAQEVGVPQRNTFVMEIGDVLSITDKSARINSRVPAGGVLVDGMALGELEGSALKERRELSEEGLVAVSIVLDKNGLLAKEPVFESRGFIHMKDATALKEELVKTINQVLGSIAGRGEKIDDEGISGRLKSRMAEVIRKNSKNRPVIISLVSRITSEKK